MTNDVSAANREVFNRPAVVAHYELREDDQTTPDRLTPCERVLFDRFLRPGSDVLDLGVGAGRTTKYLAGLGGRYVGLDWAPAMVEAAQRAYPGLDFVQGDAQDLSAYETGSFDSVVFAYNGIDYLHPDAARLRCLHESARVLRPGGVFIFSTHNPRAFVTRPRDAARHGVLHRAGAGMYLTARRLTEVARTHAFYSGRGYVRDPAHGGLETFTATPSFVLRELSATGFVHLATLAANYPARSSAWPQRTSQWFAPWYYYAARRTET